MTDPIQGIALTSIAWLLSKHLDHVKSQVTVNVFCRRDVLRQLDSRYLEEPNALTDGHESNLLSNWYGFDHFARGSSDLPLLRPLQLRLSLQDRAPPRFRSEIVNSLSQFLPYPSTKILPILGNT